MKTLANEVKLRTIKVSQKGQITIPTDIQRELGIEKGDEILLVKKGGKLMLTKPSSLVKVIEADFSDITRASELSLKSLWSYPGDDVWNKYLREQ